MAIFDPFFGFEDRRWGGSWDLRDRRTKMGRGSSIFEAEDRRSKMFFFLSFGSEDRRWEFFDLPAPNNGSKIERGGVRTTYSKIGEGGSSKGGSSIFGSETRRTLLSSIFGARRTKTYHLPPCRPEDRNTPPDLLLLPTPFSTNGSSSSQLS